MKIERFEVVDRCLFWKEKKVLIFGDLHLGYEEYLNEKGYVFPHTQLEESLGILRKVLKKTGKLNEIVLLGDVKHYFGGILRQEFCDFYKIVDVLLQSLLKNGNIIITKGNHDNILEPIIENFAKIQKFPKKNFEGQKIDSKFSIKRKEYFNVVKVVEYYILDDVLFFHGNKKGFNKHSLEIYNQKVKLIVTGHFHPAVLIEDDVKSEKFKCFLYGKIKNYNKNIANFKKIQKFSKNNFEKSTQIRDSNLSIIILPSFFPLVEGTKINDKDLLDNWLDVSKFYVFALDSNGDVYDFGVLGEG